MKAEDARIKFGGKEIKQMGEVKEPEVVSSCEMIFRSGLPSFYGDTLFMDGFMEGAQSLFKKTVDLLHPRYPIMPEYEGGYIPVKTIPVCIDHVVSALEEPDLNLVVERIMHSFEGLTPSIATRFYSEESKKDHLERARFLGVRIIVQKICDTGLSLTYRAAFEVIFQMIKQPKPDAKVSFMNAQIFDYTGEI